MRTLNLNGDWDIHVDTAGHIAYSDGDYATAQTAANAVRLFTNDAYFNQTDGIPHFDIELGKKGDASLTAIENRIREACMGVEGVTDCKPVMEFDPDGRLLGWRIYITVGNTVVTVEI